MPVLADCIQLQLLASQLGVFFDISGAHPSTTESFRSIAVLVQILVLLLAAVSIQARAVWPNCFGTDPPSKIRVGAMLGFTMWEMFVAVFFDRIFLRNKHGSLNWPATVVFLWLPALGTANRCALAFFWQTARHDQGERQPIEDTRSRSMPLNGDRDRSLSALRLTADEYDEDADVMSHEKRGVTLLAGAHGFGGRASVDSTFFSLASDGRSSTGECNDFDGDSFYDPFHRHWEGARVRTASTSSELPSEKNKSLAALLRSDSDAETAATHSGRAHVTKTIPERDWLRGQDANAQDLTTGTNRVALVVFVCGFLAARQAGVQSSVHEVKLRVLLEAAAEELPAARSWKLPAPQSELYLSPVTHLYTSLLPFFVVIPCCLLWAPARSSTRAVLFSIAFLGFLLNAVFSVPWFLLSAEAEQTKLTSAFLRRVDPGSVHRLQERLRAEDAFEDGSPEAWDRKSLLQFLDAVGTYTAAERRHDGYLDLERWQWWQFVIRPESRQLGSAGEAVVTEAVRSAVAESAEAGAIVPNTSKETAPPENEEASEQMQDVYSGGPPSWAHRWLPSLFLLLFTSRETDQSGTNDEQAAQAMMQRVVARAVAENASLVEKGADDVSRESDDPAASNSSEGFASWPAVFGENICVVSVLLSVLGCAVCGSLLAGELLSVSAERAERESESRVDASKMKEAARSRNYVFRRSAERGTSAAAERRNRPSPSFSSCSSTRSDRSLGSRSRSTSNYRSRSVSSEASSVRTACTPKTGHVEVEVELAASDVEHVESTSAPKIARRQQQRNNEKSGQDQIVPCLRVPCLSGEVSNSGSYDPQHAEVEQNLRAAVFLEKHHRDMLLLKRADVMRIAGALQLVAEEVDHVEPSDHLVTIGSHFRPPAIPENATEVICDALPVVPATFRLTAADLQAHILDVYGSLELCLLRYCYQCPDPDVTSDPSRVLFQLLKQQVFWRKHFLHPFLVGSTSCKNADKNEENPVSKRGLETLKHLLVEKWTPTIGMQPLLVDTGPWVADDGFAIEAWDCRYIQSRACLNKYSRKEIKNACLHWFLQRNAELKKLKCPGCYVIFNMKDFLVTEIFKEALCHKEIAEAALPLTEFFPMTHLKAIFAETPSWLRRLWPLAKKIVNPPDESVQMTDHSVYEIFDSLCSCKKVRQKFRAQFDRHFGPV